MNGGGSFAFQSTSTLTNGTTYHIVYTYDGTSTQKLYINGVLDATNNGGYFGGGVPSQFAIGANLGGQSYAFLNGTMDEVIYENGAWSLAQVQAEYTRLTTTVTPPSSSSSGSTHYFDVEYLQAIYYVFLDILPFAIITGFVFIFFLWMFELFFGVLLRNR